MWWLAIYAVYYCYSFLSGLYITATASYLGCILLLQLHIWAVYYCYSFLSGLYTTATASYLGLNAWIHILTKHACIFFVLQFVADFAKENLFPMILASVKESEEDFSEILTKQILDVDDQIMTEVKYKMDISGKCFNNLEFLETNTQQSEYCLKL